MLKNQLRLFGSLMILGALLMCVGCGEPKLDTSSDQAFSASLEKIYKSVPEADREAFRDYLNLTMEGKVPSSFFGGKRKVPSYDDIVKMYSLVKAMGNENDAKMLNNINGLTKADVIEKGKAILKKDLEDRRDALTKQIAETQKQLDDYKRLELEPEKVEVICTGVDVREGFNFEKKSWGTIGSIATLITVKNNSSESVKMLHGNVALSDGSDSSFGNGDLGALRAIDQPDDAPYNNDLKIAPGTEWQGKVVWKFFGPDKKHPYPPTKKYTATLSNVKAVLDVNMPWGHETQMNEDRLQNLQKSLQAVEKELVDLK